jgi:hypothetical protein
MGMTRAVTTRAAKVVCGCRPKPWATMVGEKTRDGIKLPRQHLLTKIHQQNNNPQKNNFCKQWDGCSKNTDVTQKSLM